MIGITGASGALGRATAEAVLRTVDPRRVVLTTRRPEALADLADLGARVRPADFDDVRGLTAAFEGVDRLLLVSTDNVGARLDQHRAAIAGAAAAGVAHVVYTSVPEPVPGNPAAVVLDHAGTERALRESGLRWTMLRNHLYAHLQVSAVAHAAASGRLVTNHGTGAAAYVTREDCAAAAAAALTQDGHEDRVFEVSGPEAVTAGDLVALAREIGGREVELVAVDDETFAEGLRAAGVPELDVRLITSFGASTRGGYLAGVSSAFSELTGRAPTPFAEAIRTALPRRGA
ncbi:NAD(P)H dehydrogenase (quinone) [Streptomyces sp. B3I7]|uniref:NAD(P)H-binding protein n=1 Tax=Streptomyces sp. B3I7 TaxID=3042269 RepID=UPI0027804857|nr:NAD(P)H-binding protein [Streptomyces sp. B3I7]MDQ0808879.1 NAD(P)H dehydrogenase (quinone) [Streptomyces sp. B3I7]